MNSELKFQMSTKNGYDTEIIATWEDAAAFLDAAARRATSPVWVWLDGRESGRIEKEVCGGLAEIIRTTKKVW